MKIHNWLAKVFGKAEEINGGNRCPTYLYRWVLLKTRWFKFYLHHFVGNDWSTDLHDHPKHFVSVGLWGSYIEVTERGRKIYKAPWVRQFPPEFKHRLISNPSCWTLVIVGSHKREWGFWTEEGFIPWDVYVFGDKAYLADKAKDC